MSQPGLDNDYLYTFEKPDRLRRIIFILRIDVCYNLVNFLGMYQTILIKLSYLNIKTALLKIQAVG